MSKGEFQPSLILPEVGESQASFRETQRRAQGQDKEKSRAGEKQQSVILPNANRRGKKRC